MVAMLLPSPALDQGSGVDLGEFAMRPFDGFFRRHALDRLRVHVDNDILGHRFGRGAAGGTGMTGIARRDLPDRLERQHDRIGFPHRILLPILGWAGAKALLRCAPFSEDRLRAAPTLAIFYRVLGPRI